MFNPLRDKLPERFVCIGCDLAHKQVEAAGIWYCPNPACTATGAASHRRKLESFQEQAGHHTIDIDDLIRYVNEHEKDMDDDVSIAAERCISVYWGREAD